MTIDNWLKLSQTYNKALGKLLLYDLIDFAKVNTESDFNTNQNSAR